MSLFSNSTNPNPLGEAIRRLRGKRKQADLAKAVDLTAGCWSNYECGRRIPRPRQLERIVEALGCDMTTFKTELRRVEDRGTGASSKPGLSIAVEELLKDVGRELREVEHEIDRCQSRRRLLLALRNYLAEQPTEILVSIAPG